MTHKFVRQEQTAVRLIKQFGAPAVLEKSGTLDESGPLPTLVEGGQFTVTAVQTKPIDRDKEGTNVRAGDVRFLVDTTSVAPENGDKMTFTGRKYSVVAVEAVAPAGVALLYKVVCRGP